MSLRCESFIFMFVKSRTFIPSVVPREYLYKVIIKQIFKPETFEFLLFYFFVLCCCFFYVNMTRENRSVLDANCLNASKMSVLQINETHK